VYLLHLPDFLGLPSAIALAEQDRATVEQGLRLKRIGNRLIEVLGGRSIHPVSLRVGGFWRTPDRDELRALGDDLDEAIELALATVDLVASLPTPAFEARRLLVSLCHPEEYPLNDGRIVSSDGLSLPAPDWPLAFREVQVAHSTALQARTHEGEAYLLGPTARIALAGDRLHPLAAEALERTGLRAEVEHNVFRSIVARAVELVHVAAEAHDIVDAYRQPRRHAVPWTPRAGIGSWATEAPRGLLFHRYHLDEDAVIRTATIVPPTSQNQAAIEADLARYAPQVLDLPHAEATDRLERLIRCYDPCISCATHFLDLEVMEAGA
jgi:coenzyme F420-reducing hydrogenase alpha subunit